MLYSRRTAPTAGIGGARRDIPRPAGSIKYKIGIYKTAVPGAAYFPADSDEVFRKKKMLTTFQIPHFNGTTALIYPHDDYGSTQTGLSEGFHVLRARAFLKRDSSGVGNGLRSSIYNTFVQTFYYDAQSPQGEIKFPAENETIGGSRYGVVVRTDPSVTEVWYHIDDGDASNDDTATHTQGGNGTGFRAVHRQQWQRHLGCGRTVPGLERRRRLEQQHRDDMGHGDGSDPEPGVSAALIRGNGDSIIITSLRRAPPRFRSGCGSCPPPNTKISI